MPDASQQQTLDLYLRHIICTVICAYQNSFCSPSQPGSKNAESLALDQSKVVKDRNGR